MNLIPQRRRWLLAVALSCVLGTSCADLKAVHEWSQTSLQAAQYNELITTYSSTPQRLLRYDPGQSELYNTQLDLRKRQAEALKQMLSVVSDYMAALATLSADSTIDYSKNVDTLTKSIGTLNAGISQTTLNATGSLVKTMLGAVAEAYQAKQVANIVGQANDPLQTILKGELRDIVDNDFRRDLKIEQTFIDIYYDNLRKSSEDIAAKDGVNEWKEFRMEQNAKQLKRF